MLSPLRSVNVNWANEIVILVFGLTLGSSRFGAAIAVGLVLDTNVLLWTAGDTDRRPAHERSQIEDRCMDLCSSSASIWEVAQKSGLGRADFRIDPRLPRRRLLEDECIELQFQAPTQRLSPCYHQSTVIFRPNIGGAVADRSAGFVYRGRIHGEIPGFNQSDLGEALAIS